MAHPSTATEPLAWKSPDEKSFEVRTDHRSPSSKPQFQPAILRLPSLLCLLISTLAFIALTELACARLPAHGSSGIISAVQQASPQEIDSSIQKRHAKRQNNTFENPEPTVAVGNIGGDGESVPTAPGAPAPANFIPLSSAATSSPSLIDLIPASSVFISTVEPAPSNFLPISDNPGPTTSSTPLPVVIPLPSDTILSSNGPSSSPSSAFFSGTNPSTLSPSPTSSFLASSSSNLSTISFFTGTAAGAVYTLGPGGVIYIEDNTFYTSDPTSTTLSDGATFIIGPTGTVSIQEAIQPSPTYGISVGNYVLGAFIPTILAVIYSIPWHILAASMKEMEPFYNLNRPEGMPTKDTLTMDYRNSVSIIATLNALYRGHYLVWGSGLVSFVVLFLAPLASEAVFIGFAGTATCTGTSLRVGCSSPRLSVFLPAARAVEGILAFVAVMALGLMIALWRRRSGLYATPLSIAGLATLFQHQPLIEKFRQLHLSSPDSKQLASALEGSTYRIGPYVDIDGSTRYGLHLLQSQTQPRQMDQHRKIGPDGKKYLPASVNGDNEVPPLPKQKRSISSFGTHPAAMIAFCIFICGLMALVTYYNQVGANTAFERFMDSESFGASFLFTTVGVIIKVYWTMLDNDCRYSEPYRQLCRGSAHPRDSILLSPRSNPFTGFFHSLHHAHFFNAYISLVAVLCEPLIVCLANIPFKPGHAFEAYTVATWLVVGVLSMMFVGIVWKMCRKNERAKRPGTVAGVLVHLCGSHMLKDWGQMAEWGEKARNRAAIAWGKRYTMGETIGVDLVQRISVDEDIFFSRVGVA